MEHRRVTKLCSKHNVPLDVWWEILSRLPVKSLLRFCCVSKSWKLLIEDPDFCYLHRNRFKNNIDETHLVFAQEAGYGFILCSETFETTGRLCSERFETTSLFSSGSRTDLYYKVWHICFLFDGLVLLKRTIRGGGKLTLWNPSIRKCRRLPPVYCGPEVIELGLGFDPLAKDYKLVKVGRSRVGIYTVGTNSWKTTWLRARGCSNPLWYANETAWPEIRAESVCFMGCLYYIPRSRNELVSFDLSNMVFTFGNLPANGYDSYSSDTVASRAHGSDGSYFYLPVVSDSIVLVDGGCSLAVFRTCVFGSSVWVVESSNSDATSLRWTKRYTFTFSSVSKPLYFKRSGDVVFGKVPDRFESYNIKTGAKKLLPKAMSSRSTSHLIGYKESLVLINDQDVAPTYGKMSECMMLSGLKGE